MPTDATVLGATIIIAGLPFLFLLLALGAAFIFLGSIVLLYGLLSHHRKGLNKDVLDHDLIIIGLLFLFWGIPGSTIGFPVRHGAWIPPNPTVGLPMIAFGSISLLAGVVWRRRTNLTETTGRND